MASQETREESPLLDEDIDTTQFHLTFGARLYTQPKWQDYRHTIQKITQGTAQLKRNTVNWLAWSSDGKKLASCGYEKVVRIWNPEKSTELRSTSSFGGGHTEQIDQVVWNPVHKDLLCSSSSYDRRVCFWDARQSKIAQNILLEGGFTPHQISFSPDGKTLLAHDNNRTLSLFQQERREEDGKDLWTQKERKNNLQSFNSNVSIMDSAWMKSGSAIGFAGTDGSLCLYEYPSFREITRTVSHMGQCNTLGFHPRGKYVVTGGNDALLNIWDMQEWMCVRTCSPSDETVQWLRFSADGEWIATVVNNHREVIFINFELAEVGHRLRTPGTVGCLAWHPSKLLLASCGEYPETASNGWVSFFSPPP